MEIWEPKPPGTLWATPGLLRDCFTFTLTSWNPLGHSRPVTGLLYLYLNFLEPSGPLQACNWTALPFYPLLLPLSHFITPNYIPIQYLLIILSTLAAHLMLRTQTAYCSNFSFFWHISFVGPFCYDRYFTELYETFLVYRSGGNCTSLLTGTPSSHSHRLIIPDGVLIQFDLLMMSAVTLETCRDMK